MYYDNNTLEPGTDGAPAPVPPSNDTYDNNNNDNKYQ